MGFKTRDVVAKDAAGEVLKETTTNYLSPDVPSTDPPIAPPYTRPLAGLVSGTVDTFPHADSSLNGTGTADYVLVTSTWNWQEQTSADGRPFAALHERITESDDVRPTWLGGGQLYKRTEEFQTDGYGNQSDYRVTSQDFVEDSLFSELDPNSSSSYHEHITYTPTSAELGNWLISLPKANDTDDQPRCVNAAPCTDKLKSRHTDYTYYDYTGLLHFDTRGIGDPSLARRIEYIPDGTGNIEEITSHDYEGDERDQVICYDESDLFPVSVTSGTLTTQVRVDGRFGKLAEMTDPNGIDEDWTYDDFGILRYHHSSVEDKTIGYQAADESDDVFGNPLPAAYRVTTSINGGETTQESFNALGQVVQTKRSGIKPDSIVPIVTGGFVTQDFHYDYRNRLIQQTRSHLDLQAFPDTTQSSIQYGYDNLDRLITETYPDSSVARHDYEFRPSLSGDVASAFAGVAGALSITRDTDRNGHVTLSAKDRDGRVVDVVDALNQGSQYIYGAFGALQSLFMPSGDAMSYEQDAYNRVTAVVDPALGGRRTVSYNGFDEITSSVDQAGRLTQFLYDSHGRPTYKLDSDGTTWWNYDGLGPNEQGRLIESMSSTGQDTRYEYEPRTSNGNRGLLTTVIESLTPAVTHGGAEPRTLTTQYHYDDFSRLQQIDYPGIESAPFSVSYGFDDSGHVIKASNTADPSIVYWKILEPDEGLRVGSEQFGNGVVTQRTYEPFTGRVSSISTKHGNDVVQDLSYSYDPGGNLQTRGTPDSQTFDYDPLDRLSQNSQYTYDSRPGRLTHQDAVGDYTYFSTGRDWVKTAGTNEYTHDSFGNIWTRSGPSVPGGSQEIDYTTFNLPSHISPGAGGDLASSDFAYDASDTRVIKTFGDTTTFYFDDLYQATVTPNSTSHRYMIYVDGRAVASVNQDETAGGAGTAVTKYLHDDFLGSIQSITTATGAISSSRSFGSFGQPDQALSDSDSVPYGFTGQEHDPELGLINMHGRMYDPVLGQFLSPDPVMQEPYSQGFNRFAYTFNNPLRYTDPSGFSATPTTIGIDTGLGVAYTGGLVSTLATTSGGGGAAVTAAGAATAASGIASVASVAAPAAMAVVSVATDLYLATPHDSSSMKNVPMTRSNGSGGTQGAVSKNAVSPRSERPRPRPRRGASKAAVAASSQETVEGCPFGLCAPRSSNHLLSDTTRLVDKSGPMWDTLGKIVLNGATLLGPGEVLEVVEAAEGAVEGAAVTEEASGLVASNGTRITGYTRHGLNRAIGDGAERAGTKASSILDALKNPKSITSGVDDLGRPFQAFKGGSARVVVNPETGQIVSVNPIGGAGVR